MDDAYKAITAQAFALAAREQRLAGAKKLRDMADSLIRRAEEIEADEEAKLGKK